MTNDIVAAIQALDDGFSKTKDSQIQAQLNAMRDSITIHSDKDDVQVGQKAHLKAIYKRNPDEEGTSIKVTWSLIPNDLGSLSEKESAETDYTAKRSGDQTVVAKIGSISEEINLSNQDHVLTKLKIQPSSTSTTVGKSIELKAVGEDAAGKEMDVDPIWTIESGAGDLSGEHGNHVTLTSNKTGTTKVTAQDGDKEDSVTVSVVEEKTNDEEISSQEVQANQTSNDDRSTSDQTTTSSSSTSSKQLHSTTVHKEQNPVNHSETSNQTDTIFQPADQLVDGDKQTQPINDNNLSTSQLNPQESSNSGVQGNSETSDGSVTPSTPETSGESDTKDNSDQTNQHKTYTLSTSVEGKGHVSQSPYAAQYNEGSQVTLTAQPDSDDWVFDHWTGDASGSQNPTYVTLNKDTNVKAIFVQLGNVSGTVTDTKSGERVGEATVRIAKNNQIIKEVTTDANGIYNFAGLRPDDYTLEIVKNGYITKNTAISVSGGSTLPHNESIQKEGQEEFSVVLTWGESPNDLDSHLTGPQADDPAERFHVYYSNREYSVDQDGQETVYAKLDHDDTDGFGPETITSFVKTDGVYRYFVYDFGNNSESDLAQSNAKVEVYQHNRLVNTFNVPVNQQGFIWHVFEIDQDGKVVPINTIDSDKSVDDPNYSGDDSYDESDQGEDLDDSSDQDNSSDESANDSEDQEANSDSDASSSIQADDDNASTILTSSTGEADQSSDSAAPSTENSNVDGSATTPETVVNDASTAESSDASSTESSDVSGSESSESTPDSSTATNSNQ